MNVLARLCLFDFPGLFVTRLDSLDLLTSHSVRPLSGSVLALVHHDNSNIRKHDGHAYCSRCKIACGNLDSILASVHLHVVLILQSRNLPRKQPLISLAAILTGFVLLFAKPGVCAISCTEALQASLLPAAIARWASCVSLTCWLTERLPVQVPGGIAGSATDLHCASAHCARPCSSCLHAKHTPTQLGFDGRY